MTDHDLLELAAPAVQGESLVSSRWAADAIRDAHLEGQRSATGRRHSLHRWNTSESHTVFLGLLSGSQPTPDVSALVDALELAHMALIGYLPSHRNDITDAAISHCEQALAAHRKGGFQ